MTRDRSTSTIRMPVGELPCEPSQPGPARGTCARYKAQIPKGIEPADYSTGQAGCTALCEKLCLTQILLAPAPRESRVRS